MQKTVARASSLVGRTLVSASRPQISLASRRIGAVAAPAVQSRAYHEKVIDHYERPRNVGSMSKNDTDVGTGLVGAPGKNYTLK
jgi:iron-sulfur cluster assembly enzyme ISCU, mitochondrial